MPREYEVDTGRAHPIAARVGGVDAAVATGRRTRPEAVVTARPNPMRARPVVRSSARPRRGLWRIGPALDRRSPQPPSRTRVRALWKRTSSVMAQAVGSPGGAGAGSTGAEVGDLRVEDVADQAGPPGVTGGGLASHPRRGPQDRSSHPTGTGPEPCPHRRPLVQPLRRPASRRRPQPGRRPSRPLAEVLNGCRTKRPPSSSPRIDRRRTELTRRSVDHVAAADASCRYPKASRT